MVGMGMEKALNTSTPDQLTRVRSHFCQQVADLKMIKCFALTEQHLTISP